MRQPLRDNVRLGKHSSPDIIPYVLAPRHLAYTNLPIDQRDRLLLLFSRQDDVDATNERCYAVLDPDTEQNNGRSWVFCG